MKLLILALALVSITAEAAPKLGQLKTPADTQAYLESQVGADQIAEWDALYSDDVVIVEFAEVKPKKKGQKAKKVLVIR